MEAQTQQSNKNIIQCPGGMEIFKEREKAEKIGLLVRGKVLSVGPESKAIYPTGSFLGVTDVYQGRYTSTYTAVEDCMICTFDVNNVEEMYEVITSNRDYCGLIIASMCKQLGGMKIGYDNLTKTASILYSRLQKLIEQYRQNASELKMPLNGLEFASQIKPYEGLSDNSLMDYYTELGGFNLDSIKAFFGQGNQVVRHHMQELSEVIANMEEQNKAMIAYIMRGVAVLLNNTEESILDKYVIMLEKANEKGAPLEGMIQQTEGVFELIHQMDGLLKVVSSKQLLLNHKKMETLRDRMNFKHLEKKQALEEYHSEISDEDVLYAVEGALPQILEYAGLGADAADHFTQLVNQFIHIPDKFATDDDSRKLKREISQMFYDIYEAVFLRAHGDWNKPVVIDLFLKYGFVDENLLSKEQILQLWHLKVSDNTSRVRVYTIDEWLNLVYEKKRIPSKNEFDQFYSESLREEVKQRKITEEEFKAKQEDPRSLLHFEIHNMFEYNNRVCSGRITTFVPILYSEMLPANFDRFVVNADKINESIQKVVDVDYSVFYRETFFVNRELNIEKEYVMYEAMPEIILMPSVGSKGVMWQDITEKQRDTSARFLLPVFLDTNLDDTILHLCARFRWEICRTIQGSTWNDIKYKSLTSEYLDYVQFYRKNRELSEERKEKIKNQLTKCSNRSVEVFAIDYEAWIKGESQGSIRLNKVVRRILAMYCPFRKEIRARLLAQPNFQEAIASYELERQKKVKTISNHYKMLKNHQQAVTQEMLDHLAFYEEM